MSSHLVPCALCVLAFGIVFSSGCSRDEGKPAAPSSANRAPATKVVADPPEVYMKDPVFQKAVNEAAAVRDKARNRRELFARELKNLIDAKAAAVGAEKAQAEVLASPEGKRLEQQLRQATAEFEAAQRQLQKVIHDRIAPKRVPAETK